MEMTDWRIYLWYASALQLLTQKGVSTAVLIDSDSIENMWMDERGVTQRYGGVTTEHLPEHLIGSRGAVR